MVVSEGNEQCRLDRGEASGVCADIDDPAAIAAACADLLVSAASRSAVRCARTAASVALERYTWDRTAVGPRGALPQAGPGGPMAAATVEARDASRS